MLKLSSLMLPLSLSSLLVLLSYNIQSIEGLSGNVQNKSNGKTCNSGKVADMFHNRRSFIHNSVSVVMGSALISTLSPMVANAGIDPSALQSLPVEGDSSGVATRLRQIEAERNRPEDAIDMPWEKLDDGVQYRSYREGKGEAVVDDGSRVAVEMTIRCKSFATANEPGGLKYFSTKEDTEFNEVAFTIGRDEIIPQLEEGMKGMKKGSIRRIEVPTEFVYAAKKNGQLPLPSENNKDGKRRFENLFKADATLIFEVLVTRVK